MFIMYSNYFDGKSGWWGNIYDNKLYSDRVLLLGSNNYDNITTHSVANGKLTIKNWDSNCSGKTLYYIICK